MVIDHSVLAIRIQKFQYQPILNIILWSLRLALSLRWHSEKRDMIQLIHLYKGQFSVQHNYTTSWIWTVFFFFSLQNSSGMNVMDLAMEIGQGQCVDYFNAGGDAPGHMICHMIPASPRASPFINGASGRRKRSPAEEEEGMCSETSKRARVEDGRYWTHMYMC